MAHKYVLKDRLEAVPADAPVAEGTPVAEVLTSKEFVDLSFGTQDMQQSLRNLATVENTYLDVFPSFLIGSFAVPNKNHVLGIPSVSHSTLTKRTSSSSTRKAPPRDCSMR